MANTSGNPSRIHLKGMGRHEEADAAGVVRPGQLLRLNVDGCVVPHNIVSGQAERLFALEDALQGRPVTTDYASGEMVSIVIANPGDEIYAWLTVGQSVSKGDFLGSDGFGHLVAADESGLTQGIDSLAVALETLDNSESGDVNARIKVRVL